MPTISVGRLRLNTLLAAAWVGILAFAVPAVAQDLRCGSSTVRLVCDNRDNSYAPNWCARSHAEFRPDQGKISIVHGPDENDPSLIPTAVTCVHGSNHDYVLVRFDNGGNCDECEVTDVFTTDGEALTRRERLRTETMDRLGIPHRRSTWIQLQ